MEIDEVLWDDGNRPHLAAHGVSEEEVEALLDLDEWVVMRNRRYPEQIRMIGYTPSGRWLTIPMVPTPRVGLWRPVTAWDSAQDEIDYWREQRPI